MTKLRTRLTREQARELMIAIEPFSLTYADSSVTIDDDLRWWGENNQSEGPEELASSRRAVQAALPELRRAARRVLDIIGED